jgi:hypothetical protein
LAGELDLAMATFARLFGRRPASVIAPDYAWTERVEGLWSSRDLRVVQAKREQRHPERRSGRLRDRLTKVAVRAWERAWRPELVYLERNCRLEVVQAADPAAATRRCVAEVRRAWRRGEPAVVESHRINFVHLDGSVERVGRAGLNDLLGTVAAVAPGPLFLTDTELAQLHRRGTSWCRRGDKLVVRNLTHGRKVVWVPGAAEGTGVPSRVRFLALAPGETRILAASDLPSVAR